MKHRKLTSLICGGVLSLTTANLLAQDTTSPSRTTSPQSPSSTASPQSGSLGQSSSSSGSSASSWRSGSDLRLSQIMNSTVQSQEGKTLGYIRDLTINPQSGQVEFAILSLSSAGAATDTSTSGRETAPSSRSSTVGTPSSASGSTTTGKLIPVPWQLFNQSSTGSSTATSSTTASAMGSQNLVLNIDESKLRTAPSFDSSDWNQLQGGTLDQRVHSHFGVDRSSATGTPGSSISGQGASGSSVDRSGTRSSTSGSSSSSTSNPDR